MKTQTRIKVFSALSKPRPIAIGMICPIGIRSLGVSGRLRPVLTNKLKQAIPSSISFFVFKD